jgi:hypothetical protein
VPVNVDDGGHVFGLLNLEISGHDHFGEEDHAASEPSAADGGSMDSVSSDQLSYSELDQHGVADSIAEHDAQHAEVGQAQFDPANGNWSVSSGSAAGSDAMIVDTRFGAQSVGPATVTSGAAGVPDTAVVHDPNGDVILYTDANGDHQADVALEVTSDGHIVRAEHVGAGNWVVVERGHLDAHGQYVKDPAPVGQSSPGDFTPPLPAASAPEAAAQVLDAPTDNYWSSAEAAESQPSDGAIAPARIDTATGLWV